jgi:hypothetical protein
MVQPLHVPGGVPADLRGYYAVPLDEERKYQWGLLNAKMELAALRSWVANGYKQSRAGLRGAPVGQALSPLL